MKRIFTFPDLSSKKVASRTLMGTLLFSVLFFIGCYEWTNILQPTDTDINSYFDVFLVAGDDGNPDNDWTNPDNHDIGLLGIMLPGGWTVRDSVEYHVITTEAGYNNNGIMIYSAEHSQTLQDSIPAPWGYYWWGAKSDGEVSLVYFDTLYLEPRIFTSDQTGDFYMRYAIGDENYWDRNPADDVSDPIPITAHDYSDVDELLANANVSLYPNPVSDVLNIYFASYRSQVIHMQIVDVTGKVIIAEMLMAERSSINVGNLSKGIYFVTLQNGENSSVKKIIVK